MTSMNEVSKVKQQPDPGAVGIFDDVILGKFFFVTLKEYTMDVINGVYQKCYVFTVGTPSETNQMKLTTTLNHPDLTWLDVHPDDLPSLIEASLIAKDEQMFMEYSEKLLDWQEDLKICGKLYGYNALMEEWR